MKEGGRAILLAALTAFGTETLSSCNFIPQKPVIRDVVPGSARPPQAEDRPYPPNMTAEQRLILQEKNPDPMFRAANSFVIAPFVGPVHAFVLEDEGKLKMGTASDFMRHIAWKDDLTVYIPGFDPIAMNVARLQYAPNEMAMIQFTDEESQVLEKIIQAKQLRPLHFAKQLPKEQEDLLIPQSDTGQYSRFRLEKKQPKGNSAWIRAVKGSPLTCAFRGGSPVLKTEKGRPTQEVYGVVTGFDTEIPNLRYQSFPCFERVHISFPPGISQAK